MAVIECTSPDRNRAVQLLQGYLLRSAAARPDQVALVCAEKRLTYADLLRRCCRLAWALRRRGIARGDRVAIFAESGVEAVVGFWAALLADAVVVPVSPLLKKGKLVRVLQDCGAVAFIGGRAAARIAADAVHEAGHVTILLVAGGDSAGTSPFVEDLDTAIQCEEREDIPPCLGIDLDLAALIYTSGSTGDPKGVMLSHRNMLTAANSIAEYLALSRDDVLFCGLPLAFDYGLYQLILSVRSGARLVLERSMLLPADVLGRIAVERVTVLPGVPTLFAMLDQVRDVSRWDCASVRAVTNTAGPLHSRHVATLHRLFPRARIFSMYGLTECKRCSYLPPEDLDRKPNSVGFAIPNTELWLVDERDQRLGPGEVGQLVIRGATVMQGYWGKPDETARVLKPGPVPGERVLYTGDLCRLDDEGYLYFVSRMDEVIKSRGEKVAPAEIEAVLLSVPGVREVAVVGVPDQLLGEAIRAFVVPDDGVELTAAGLRRACEEHLEAFMIPQRFEMLPSLPRTDTGKVARRALR